MRRFAGAFVAAAMIALVTLAAASAEDDVASTGATTAHADGSVVTITINIDFVDSVQRPTGLNPRIAAAVFLHKLKSIEKLIENYWNREFDRLGSGCLTFRLDVVADYWDAEKVGHRVLGKFPDGTPRNSLFSRPGAHVVLWVGEDFGLVPLAKVVNSYDEDGYASPGEDFFTPFQHDLWGVWSERLDTDFMLAHEVGHLMGLGDDYGGHDAAPLPGREGTLMADGDVIDQNLLGRLANVIRSTGVDLLKCETWEGTWDSVEGGGVFCPGEAHGTFTMVVGPGGVVNGQGTYIRTNCQVSLTDQGFLVTGRKTESGFHLVIPGGIGGTPTFEAPIDGKTAKGTWEAPYQRWTIKLECTTDCDSTDG